LPYLSYKVNQVINGRAPGFFEAINAVSLTALILNSLAAKTEVLILTRALCYPNWSLSQGKMIDKNCLLPWVGSIGEVFSLIHSMKAKSNSFI